MQIGNVSMTLPAPQSGYDYPFAAFQLGYPYIGLPDLVYK